MRQLPSLLVLIVSLCAGCPSPTPPASSAPAAPALATESPEPVAIENREVPVKCGCELDVKTCSEWADLDGQWVQLTGNHGLGSMPFCGKANLRARVAGNLKDGKLHLTWIELLP